MERVIITTLCYHGTDCRVAAWQSNGKISRICLRTQEERLLEVSMWEKSRKFSRISKELLEGENRTSCYFPYTKESNFLYNAEENHPGTRRRRTSGAGDQRSDKNKAPAVSSNLNFTGKYLVLTTENRTRYFAKIPS